MKLNLHTKLLGGLAAMLLMIIVMGSVNMYLSNRTQNRLQTIMKRDAKSVEIIGDLGRRASFVHSNCLLHTFENSVDDMDRYEAEIADWVSKISRNFETLKESLKDQAILDKLRATETSWKTYLQVWNEQVKPLSRANLDEEAFALMRKRGPAGAAVREAMYELNELYDRIVEKMRYRVELAKQDFRKEQLVLLSIILAAIIFGLAFGLRLSSRIAGAVNRVSKSAKRVAAGDLDQKVEVKTGDEIESMADSFNIMTGRLKTMMEAEEKARKELQALNETLEQRVAERTRDLKDSNEMLVDSEKKFRGLIEALPVGISLSTPGAKGTVTDINSAQWKMFGYDSKEEFLKLPASAHYQDPNERERFSELRERGPVKHHLLQFKRKDGALLWGSVSSVTQVAEDGTIQFINVVEDITKEKKLEAQLRQAQKMEAVGRLAGGVAHDFNNLLMSIMGHADLALMSLAEDDPLRRNLEEIKGGGKRAAALTRQLLAFSRRQILQPVVLDLNALITGFVKMLERLIGEDVELETVLASGLRRVEADPGQMEQVIMNLVINARDAMPGGGKLTIETVNVDLDEDYVREHDAGLQPGPYVMLGVSDAGTGMDEETRSLIFEPFFTTKEEGEGTGLGLSTVYGIVKQSGGYIWVYSEPGQGTTFKIYLPAVEGEAVSREKEEISPERLTGSETILIVEDDDKVRNLVCEILEPQGYSILEAENGIEALRVSEEHGDQIHLMIADVIMPKMGGRELAERLRPLRPDMKVIYMSGYTDNAILHHGVLSPGIEFLQKPISSEALKRKVREVLDQ